MIYGCLLHELFMVGNRIYYVDVEIQALNHILILK